MISLPACQKLGLPKVRLDGQLFFLLKVFTNLVAVLPYICCKSGLVLRQVINPGLNVFTHAGYQQLLDLGIDLNTRE